MLVSNALLHKLGESAIPVYPSVTGQQQSISAHSAAEFFYAMVWACALLVAFTGWGRLVGRICREKKLPASVACATGIAVIIFLGGLLNGMRAIYSPVLFALVAIGILLYGLYYRQRPPEFRWSSAWKQASGTARILFLFAFLILSVRIAGTVRLVHFDVSDDSSAYLAFPKKMLAVHQFAPDPFSERRNSSSLGGSYFLQDLILSATSLSNIAMADRTEGLMLLAAAVFDLGIIFELSIFNISFLELLVFLIPQETFNLTFVVLPVPLLLSVIWLIYADTKHETNSGSLRYAFLAGLIGGATISLKSTYLPVIGAFIVVPYLFLLTPRRIGTAAKMMCVAAVGILIVLVPWMIAMKLTGGTYLFPILGRGLDYSARGLFRHVTKFPTSRSVVKVFLQGLALLLLGCIQILAKPRTRISNLNLSVLISAGLSITAVNYATGADSIWRYNFPLFFVAVIVFFSATAAVHGYQDSRSTRAVYAIGIAAMLAMIFYYDMAGQKPELFHEITLESTDMRSLIAGITGRRLTDQPLKEEYRNAEQTIPKNGNVLENTAYPFLLDFKTHSINIMDWPGASAPYPGWPFGAGPASVSRYLQHNSIRYLIVDYRYMFQNDTRMCQDLQNPNRFSEWLREQLWMNILVDHQLNQVRSDYPLIYNDGSIAVVDLAKPIAGSFDDDITWAIDTKADTVCTAIASRYFGSKRQDIPAAQSIDPDTERPLYYRSELRQ